ncbi:hypothetical protein [Pseudooceanicola aestuarii]|uniref:hypothetical protein n=1 Tax=Pseudooceanicola aestuarii TaxID=2697319 RepID=UPI0013D7C32F|nr:hypothetical protein [Pseudooceanicola aestuarii]
MATRVKSQDGRKETEEVLGQNPEDMEPAPGQQGRKGGELQRKVGTRVEEADHDPSTVGNTDATGQDKNRSGDKEDV